MNRPEVVVVVVLAVLLAEPLSELLAWGLTDVERRRRQSRQAHVVPLPASSTGLAERGVATAVRPRDPQDRAVVLRSIRALITRQGVA